MLKVLINGTWFAGEGHSEAFSWAGAEVVGIVGWTPHVVSEVAGRFSIPYAGTDCQYQKIFDLIRRNNNWTDVSALV